ncbi:hypothetical protein [Leifsonia sp. P73]
MLIAGQSCLPPDALSAVEHLGVKTAVLVGGTAALSTGLDTLTTCR